MTETKSFPTAETAEPISADEWDGDEECEYQDCEEPADWIVEARSPGADPGAFLCCQSCSIKKRIYAEENDLSDYPVSETAKHAFRDRRST